MTGDDRVTSNKAFRELEVWELERQVVRKTLERKNPKGSARQVPEKTDLTCAGLRHLKPDGSL